VGVGIRKLDMIYLYVRIYQVGGMMEFLKWSFAPVVGALGIYLANHNITPRWPTAIVTILVLAIGYRLFERKAPNS
jgi:hypothetical protein